MNNLIALFFTFLLSASLSHAIVDDFCVADMSLPKGPEGYSCKDPATVTTDDFVFTGFRVNRSIIPLDLFNSNITGAFVDAFPALNGLGISMARLDFGINGVIPVHAHRTSEIIIVVRGTIIAGFIDTNDVAYYRTLQVGDVMIFPQGMLHFQVNVGRTPALAFVSLNSPNPGVQFTSSSLFAGNLPSNIVEQITLINHQEVSRLKTVFGGTS